MRLHKTGTGCCCCNGEEIQIASYLQGTQTLLRQATSPLVSQGDSNSSHEWRIPDRLVNSRAILLRRIHEYRQGHRRHVWLFFEMLLLCSF